MTLKFEETPKNIILAGAAIIILQNLIIFFNNIGDLDEDEYLVNTFDALYDYEFQYVIDIIGFGLLGAGFILSSQRSKSSSNDIVIGIMFVGWTVMRIIWQFITLQDEVETDILEDDLIFDTSLVLFLIGNILLAIAIYLVYSRDSSNLGMLAYLIINTISSIFIFLMMHTSTLEPFESWNEDVRNWLSFKLKLIIAPTGAIVAMGILLNTLINEK